MGNSKRREQLREIMSTVKNYRSSRVLTTAVTEEIFERFEDEALTLEQITNKNENQEAVARLVTTLCSMGYLENTDQNLVHLTEITRNFLVSESPLDVRPVLKLFHKNYELWGRLPETLEKGHEVEGDVFGDVEFGKEFMEAMEVRAQFVKSDVAEALSPVLSENDKILDLGGGTGIFSREILKRNPTVEAQLADLPHVVEIAREFVEPTNLLDRINFRKIDFFEDEDYGKNCDIVLLFSIVHMFGKDKNRTILNRTADALKTGGKLIVRDYVLNDDYVGPVESNLFNLHMLLATESGTNYTRKEYKTLFNEAGLQYDRKLKIEGNEELLLAEKL